MRFVLFAIGFDKSPFLVDVIQYIAIAETKIGIQGFVT